MSNEIPKAIADAVLAIGKVEWGLVNDKSDEDHVKDFAETLRITRQHFGMDGNQGMNGVYKTGLEVAICLTGTSPNSGKHAQAIVGAWNYLVDLAAQQHAVTQQTETLASEIESADKLGGSHGV